MQDFFANCATVLQKYGFSYLRGAGTTLLLALVGTFFGCLIGFAVGALQTIPVDKQWPGSMDTIPPRTVSAIYAPVLMDTMKKPACHIPILMPKTCKRP